MSVPQESAKKISILVPPDFIRLIEESGLTQTKAVLEALEYYFSEDRKLIESNKIKILESEKKIIELTSKLSESDKFRALLEDQNEINKAHISQVQTLITQMENERRYKEEVIRQKEDKILLLEEGTKKKKWWKPW